MTLKTCMLVQNSQIHESELAQNSKRGLIAKWYKIVNELNSERVQNNKQNCELGIIESITKVSVTNPFLSLISLV